MPCRPPLLPFLPSMTLPRGWPAAGVPLTPLLLHFAAGEQGTGEAPEAAARNWDFPLFFCSSLASLVSLIRDGPRAVFGTAVRLALALDRFRLALAGLEGRAAPGVGIGLGSFKGLRGGSTFGGLASIIRWCSFPCRWSARLASVNAHLLQTLQK